MTSGSLPPAFVLAAASLLSAVPAAVHAQECVPQQHPAFAFQVDASARVLPDSIRPRPTLNPFAASKDDPNAIIVQFVVDTAGTPLPQTFKVLKAPSIAISDIVRAVLPLWRFTPGRIGACTVVQLVQTSIER